MTHTRGDARSRCEVTIWSDPLCPFWWNTTRWLTAVAYKTGVSIAGVSIDWQLMSLAVLNQGRELPPRDQARMRRHARSYITTSNKNTAGEPSGNTPPRSRARTNLQKA